MGLLSLKWQRKDSKKEIGPLLHPQIQSSVERSSTFSIFFLIERGLFKYLEVWFKKIAISLFLYVECMANYPWKTAGWEYFPKPDATNQRKTHHSLAVFFSFCFNHIHTFLQRPAHFRFGRIEHIGADWQLTVVPFLFASYSVSHPISVNQPRPESQVQSG